MKNIRENSNLVLMLSGKFISLLGNSVFDMGLIWYVLDTYGTESGPMLSYIMILGILPTVLLGGVIGALVDRWNKKFILLFADSICIIFTIGLVLLQTLHWVAPWQLLLVTAILSLASSSVSISITSMLPELFAGEHLIKANAGNQLVERLAQLLGLASGGVLVAVIGLKNAFLFTGIAFILSFLTKIFLQYEPQRVSSDISDTVKISVVNAKSNELLLDEIKEDRNISKRKITLGKDLIDIFKYLKEHGELLGVVLLITIVNFLWDPLLSLGIPYIMKNEVGVNSMELGFVEASIPLGFSIGALVLSRKGELLNKHKLFYKTMWLLNIILVLLILPLIFSSVANNKKYIVYCIALLMTAGIGSAFINIGINLYYQKTVPQELLGKFLGISRSLGAGLMPISAAILGQILGKIPTWWCFSFAICGVFLVLLLKLFAERKHDIAV